MKCKKCKLQIDDDSRYCKWCGQPAIKQKQAVRIPTPRQLPSGQWNIQLRKEGISITEQTAEKATAKAVAIRQGWLKADATIIGTVGDLIDNYIADTAPVLSPSTTRAYMSYRAHRFTGVMDMPPGRVNWQRAVNKELEEVSAKTVLNAWRLITAALGYAGAEVPEVKLPQTVKKEKAFLDYEQILKFTAAIEGDRIELAALLGLHGLRRSEIYDITKADIDLKAGTIRVAGSAVYGPEGIVHKDTNKNSTSCRTVPIMIPRLKELTESCPDTGYLVKGDNTDIYRAINRRCKALGLPEVGIHGLRHSAVSLAYHLDWSTATTMQVFGYSNLTTVQEVYTHLAEADKNSNIVDMKKFYGSSEN